MRRSLLALLLILVASATAVYARTSVASEPLVRQQEETTATPEPQAEIFIFMESSLTTTDAAPKVAVDDREFCGLTGGTYCKVTIRPGKHNVAATIFEKRRTSVDLDVLAGETYYLEVAPKFSHLELFAVPKEKALPALAKATAIDPVGPEAAVVYNPAYWRQENERRKALANQPAAEPICKPWPSTSDSHKCQVYPGDKRPKRDIAIVKVSNLDAKSLDGNDIIICTMPWNGPLKNRDCGGVTVDSIELLPGKYTIGFMAAPPYWASAFSSTDIQFFDLTAEAGKTYKFNGDYSIIKCTGSKCEGQWSIEFK